MSEVQQKLPTFSTRALSNLLFGLAQLVEKRHLMPNTARHAVQQQPAAAAAPAAAAGMGGPQPPDSASSASHGTDNGSSHGAASHGAAAHTSSAGTDNTPTSFQAPQHNNLQRPLPHTSTGTSSSGSPSSTEGLARPIRPGFHGQSHAVPVASTAAVTTAAVTTAAATTTAAAVGWGAVSSMPSGEQQWGAVSSSSVPLPLRARGIASSSGSSDGMRPGSGGMPGGKAGPQGGFYQQQPLPSPSLSWLQSAARHVRANMLSFSGPDLAQTVWALSVLGCVCVCVCVLGGGARMCRVCVFWGGGFGLVPGAICNQCSPCMTPCVCRAYSHI